MPSLALESSPIGFLFSPQILSFFGLMFNGVSCIVSPDLGPRYVVPALTQVFLSASHPLYHDVHTSR